MEEKKDLPLTPQQPEGLPGFPTGKRELIFGLLMLIFGLAVCNFTLYGGFNLGFAVVAVCIIICGSAYLLSSGHKLTAYSGALLVLSIVIALGFARSNDIFVKFVMVCFLFVGVNLGFCLTTGKNLQEPGRFSSLGDAFVTFFGKGLGKMSESAQGLKQAFGRSGSAGQKGGAFLLGIALCIPVLVIVIPLLVSADAAFSGLVNLLPEFQFGEFLTTVLVGTFLAFVFYTRGTALVHAPKQETAPKAKKGMSEITVNTVFCGVAVVYVAYLISQLAYFFGGFAGILPEGYSTAEYARRGFFEMAVLSGVNLCLIAVGLRLIKADKTPVFSKVLCVFIGLVSLLLIATASAKMFLYIGTYGLTPLRVMTQIIMLFLAVSTLVVMVWLFVPKLPYMKAVILAALVIGAVTFWVDVDTVVANYNVDAYLSGKLETVDVAFLYYDIGPEAAGPMEKLAASAPDAWVQKAAREYVERYRGYEIKDLRYWNYVVDQAGKMVKD